MRSPSARGAFILLFLLGLLAREAGAARTATPAAPNPAVTVVDDGVLLAWQAPEPIREVTAGGVRITMPGFESLEEPGKPVVPVASVLVAVPPGAEPGLTVATGGERVEALPEKVALAPRPEGVTRGADGQIAGGRYVATTTAAPFDPPPVAYEEAGIVRGIRLGRVTFYPARPAEDGLHVVTRVTARLTFGAQNHPIRPGSRASHEVPRPDPLQEAVRALVVNPGQARARPAAPSASLAAEDGPLTAMIEVSEPGLTAVAYDDLAGAGYPVATANPHNVHVARDGVEVRAEWDGDADGSFEPGERFLFYADPAFSRWARTDVYVLWADDSPGLRMSSQDGAPGGLAGGSVSVRTVAERNLLYTPECACGSLPPGRDGDRWVWDDLRRPGRPDNEYAIALPTVNGSAAATLTLWLIGFTDVDAAPDHEVSVTLNDSYLGSVTWDGKEAVTRTLSIPAGTLQASNQLALSLPGLAGVPVEGVWLDAAAVEYARGNAAVETQVRFRGETPYRAYTLSLAATAGVRAYDVTVPAQPARLTGVHVDGDEVRLGDRMAGRRQYAVTAEAGVLSPAAVRVRSELQTAAVAGADVIMIAPDAFIAALDPLVGLRESQGMTVAVESLAAIFDNVAEGEATPEAIRTYLADAYTTWQPRPATVLLVGDGTNDPKQYKEDSRVSWLPPYLADVDPWSGEAPADNRFAAVDGDDILPDMAIGRLPVNSLEEAETVVAKIVGYEADAPFGDWNGRVTLVADDRDSAGDFAAQSDALAEAFVADPWRGEGVYYTPPDNAVGDVQKAIAQKWSHGRGLMIFTGHSSVHQWGAERFFHLDDVAALDNGGRLPVVLEMTCFTSSFQHPYWDTLDEALLRREGGGAVAIWGPTGLGVATGHRLLAEGFLDSLMVQNEPALGAAILAGKVNLMAQQPAHKDLVDTFTLLGDPATRYNLDFWPGFASHLPVVRRID